MITFTYLLFYKFQNEELISHLTETYPDIIKTYDDAIEVVLNSDVILSCVSDPAAVKDVSNHHLFHYIFSRE